MTHPDDEISISAWIKRLRRNGNEVYLSWTHSNDTREQEARAAAWLLDVPQKNLFFHGATDGSVCDELTVLKPRFRALMAQIRPDRVCCGAYEQGHLDHDATNFLVSQTAPCLALEIPFYHTYRTRFQTLNRFSDARGQDILDLGKDEQALKKMMAKQYPSQNIWQVLLWYEISQTVRLRRMQLVRTERLRLMEKWNYLRPNHPPKISRKVQKTKSWKRWESAMRAYSPEQE